MTMGTPTETTVATQSVAFERFAGLAGIMTGLSSLLGTPIWSIWLGLSLLSARQQ